MAMPNLPLGTAGKTRIIHHANGAISAQAKFRDLDGTVRKVRRTAGTKRAAENALREALRDRTGAAVSNSKTISGQTRFRTLAERWKEDLENSDASTTTRVKYLAASRQLVVALGDVTVAELTVARCEAYLVAVSVKTPTKAKVHRTVLTAHLGIAVRHGAIPANPVREVGGMKKPGRKAVVAPDAEFLEMIRRAVRLYFNECDTNYKGGPRKDRALIDILDVSMGTGARIGEVLALRWLDICWETGQVSFTGRIVGPGREEGLKGGKISRTVTLPDFVLATLLDRKIRVKANPNDAIFATRTGRFYAASSIHGDMAAFREAMGLPSTFTFHAPRKAVATLLATLDSPLTAADQLGHDRSNITLKTYVPSPAAAPDSSALIQEAFGKPLD